MMKGLVAVSRRIHDQSSINRLKIIWLYDLSGLVYYWSIID